MRHRRLLVVLAITGGLWAPRDAAAVCQGPYLGTGPQLPLGCPLHVYAGFEPAPVLRQITVLRNGMYADATGQISNEIVQLTVKRTFLDCQLQPLRMEDAVESYEHSMILPVNVAVGDRIGLGSGWIGGIEIVAAAPCPAPVQPMPACTEAPPCGGSPPPFESFESNGCAAPGGGGLPSALALLGLLGARRRRRR